MFESGDIVSINDIEYAIISIMPCNKITYLYLMSLTTPPKVLLAKQIDELGNIETIKSQEEKEYILARFNSIN